MKAENKKDWAQELIEKMHEVSIAGQDDATKAFEVAYVNGDSVEAWEAFSAKATREEDFSDGQYALLIFPDDSCYADWKQETDRFFPSVSDLMEEDEDVRARLR